MEGLTTLPSSSALAGALQRSRQRYNTRLALARRRGLRLDPVALARHLAEGVAPVVEAVAGAVPERVDSAAEALFDLSLELLARDLVGPGPRQAVVGAAWRETFPRVARLLAEAPQEVAGALTNAAWRLSAEPGARPGEWLAALAQLAGLCAGVPELLAAGQVLAWRAGMAHYRASALEVWERLPEPLAKATLGLAPDAPVSREALRAALADPWWRPGAPSGPPALRLVATVGGFQGFGGPFLAPPRVGSDGERLWALDGVEAHTIHADAFGQTIQRAPAGTSPSLLDPADQEGVQLKPDGTLTFGGLAACIPALAGASMAAAAGGLLAVTRPGTHRILLVARTGGTP